jgi:AcrR family transcriptional regulator
MSATPTKTRTASPRAASARKTGVREQAAQTTRDNILKAATKVFARYGYEGGSVEKISKAAKSFDRMIYYYFGSKEGLFIEVLEETYRRMNDAESKLDLDTAKPVEALQAVIRFVVGYYRKNPEFITLLNTENLHKGKHISKSMRAREYSSPAIEVIRRVLESGQAQGLFRKDAVLLASAATPQTARQGTCPKGWSEIGRLDAPAACMGTSPCGASEASTHPDCTPTRGRHPEHRSFVVGRPGPAHPRRRHHRGE